MYVDDLVYESTPKSDDPSLAPLFANPAKEREKTFHFALATDRFKDNRIPPKGFSLDEAATRLSQPVWKDVKDTPGGANYFTQLEYAGGYDDFSLAEARDIRLGGVDGFPAGAARVEIKLYYQGTSREYVEFLRDEINGSATNPNFLTLKAGHYVIQTDAFFSQLKAWGNTMWNLWHHNHGLDGSGAAVPGIVPFEMTNGDWSGNCVGDLDKDGDVDASDLSTLIGDNVLISMADYAGNFGSPSCTQ